MPLLPVQLYHIRGWYEYVPVKPYLTDLYTCGVNLCVLARPLMCASGESEQFSPTQTPRIYNGSRTHRRFGADVLVMTQTILHVRKKTVILKVVYGILTSTVLVHESYNRTSGGARC